MSERSSIALHHVNCREILGVIHVIDNALVLTNLRAHCLPNLLKELCRVHQWLCSTLCSSHPGIARPREATCNPEKSFGEKESRRQVWDKFTQKGAMKKILILKPSQNHAENMKPWHQGFEPYVISKAQPGLPSAFHLCGLVQCQQRQSPRWINSSCITTFSGREIDASERKLALSH